MNSTNVVTTPVSEAPAGMPLFTVRAGEAVPEAERRGPVRALPMTELDWIDFDQYPGIQSPLNDF